MGHNKTRKGRVARLIRMGKKLKRLRENFNLTQQQVAEALGIDRSTYAYYELGRTLLIWTKSISFSDYIRFSIKI